MKNSVIRFYGVRFSAVVLLLVSLIVTAWGQAPPPPPASTLVVVPQFTKAVVGLSFNTTTHQQVGNFSVSVSMGTPPPGQFYTYAWSSADNALTFDSPDAASTGAHASGTGIYYATCSVSLIKIETFGEMLLITLMNSGSGSSECAAIGGPISVAVSHGTAPATYKHDQNDKSASFYLTYYNYSHQSPKPSLAEPTQDASMSVPSQPKITRNGVLVGTTLSWTLPGSTYSADPLTGLTLNVSAEGAFKTGNPS